MPLTRCCRRTRFERLRAFFPKVKKFTYDALYIKKQSFWLDLKLIALSFWITFRGKWEYRGKKF